MFLVPLQLTEWKYKHIGPQYKIEQQNTKYFITYETILNHNKNLLHLLLNHFHAFRLIEE